MSIITTSNFSSDLVPLVKNWFGIAYKELPSFFDKMFKVEQADARAYQTDALVSGMGLLQQKDESNALTIDHSKQLYTPQYRHITYALGFVITMEMMEDGDAMKNAKKFTEMLKRSALKTREVLAAQVYNRAFNSSYTMLNGDGKELISSAHPTTVGSQSNLITGGSVDISEAALEQITVDIKNLKDDRGIRIGALPKRLICSVTDEPQANRILKSTKRVGVADNDLNYVGGLIGDIVANPYLSDSDAYFVLTDVDDGLKFLNRKDPTIDQGADFDTKNAKFSVIMRCSLGWSDFRGIIGSAGA